MDIREYADLFTSGKPATVPVKGLAGRIIRGKTAKDFETLTDDPERRIVMLVDEDGLSKLPGLSGYEMLIKVGYEPEYLEHKVQSGDKFKLVVFPTGQTVRLATWDETMNMVADVYPEFAHVFRNTYVRNAIRSTPFDDFQKQAGFKFLDVEKAGKGDPRFMTADRFRDDLGSLGHGGTPEIWKVRAFLYFSVHLRELYTGTGYTATSGGSRGVPEYIIPNRPIVQLGESRIMDVDVQIPKSGLGAIAVRAQQKGELPLPPFFQAANAESWTYYPNLDQLIEEAAKWRKQHDIKASGADGFKIVALGIDQQKDFTHPQGSLYVGGRSGRGGIEDTARSAAWRYRYLHRITADVSTMDTHFAQQIFTRSMLVDRDGNPVSMFKEVPTELVLKGEVRINPAVVSWLCNGNYDWAQKQLLHYCRELEKKGKYVLLAWPFHCVLGSPGHALAGVLFEAKMFHAFVRGAQSDCEVKGGNPLTENYSILSPEVLTRHDGKPLAQRNTGFIKKLLSFDAIVIDGQAASHCVLSSIDDLLTDILQQDPSLAKKVYIMEDCMSAVKTPFRDYTPEAEAALDKFRNAGMNVVRSTDPLESWPGIRL